MKINTKNEVTRSEIINMSVAVELLPVAAAGLSELSLELGDCDGLLVGVVTTAGASKVNE